MLVELYRGAIEMQAVDNEFLTNVNKLVAQAEECYRTFKSRAASQTIMELAQLGNVYFDHKKPWQDAKGPETHGRMMTTIVCCLECIKAMA